MPHPFACAVAMSLVEIARVDRQALYGGALQVLRQVPPLIELCALAARKIAAAAARDEESMGNTSRTPGANVPSAIESASPGNPHLPFTDATTETTDAVTNIRPDADASRAKLCREFESDPEARRLMRATLEAAGAAGPHCYVDRLRLRVQPSGAGTDDIAAGRFKDGRFSCSLPVHRDTWGSGIAQQINWWAPLLPLAADRTMQLFPTFFDVPVSNTSKEWDYDALRASRSGTSSATVATAAGASDAADEHRYPQMPVLALPIHDMEAASVLEAELRRDALPIVIAPGDLLVFSGAHLHGSVDNTSGITRYSVEWRTVDGRDWPSGPGAPMVRTQKAVLYLLTHVASHPSHSIRCRRWTRMHLCETHMRGFPVCPMAQSCPPGCGAFEDGGGAGGRYNRQRDTDI